MGRIFYARHGRTAWNMEGKLLGKSDIPLCPEGIEEVRGLVGRLGGIPIDCIISSPLRRAVETATLIAKDLQIVTRVESGLRERDFGSFEGIHRSVLVEKYGLKPGQPLSEVLPADAEHLDDVAARVWPVLERSLDSSEDVLHVSHAGVFRSLWQSRIVGEFSELKFGQVWEFICEHGIWKAVQIDLVQ